MPDVSIETIMYHQYLSGRCQYRSHSVPPVS